MTTYFPSYVLEVMSTGVDVVAYYNDWPAYRANAPEGTTKTVSVRLNAMTIEGANVLKLVARAPDPEAPLAANAHVDVRLFRMLSDDEMLFVYRHIWRNAWRPLGGSKDYVEIARHEQTWGQTFGRWRWEDGRFYMPEDRPAILSVLEQVRSALSARDIPKYVELNRVKLEEIGRATGRIVESATRQQQDLLQGVADLPGWRVSPIVPEEIVLESCALGRLVQVFGKDYGPPIVAEVAGDGPMAFQMTFGRVDGRWLPVR
jgi:hypothetical protein